MEENEEVVASTRTRLTLGIRAAIGRGELRAGSRLSERELCERYGVSRTVVREALRQLEAEGFVNMEAHRGAIVSEISFDRAEHLFEIRGALESLACELCAAKATIEQKRKVADAVGRIERAINGGTLDEILVTKNQFYEALLSGAGNPELTTALRLLHARIQQLRRYSLSADKRLPQSLREIQAICNAIIAGDAEGASRAAKYHVSQARFAALPQIFKQQYGGLV
ncbi:MULTISPECIES: GntR family transcriptional regulator [unclassified Caballeronia]|uniref:GntR family transcriptional regulator n=1 Tax=unclassified Caballeronia TaxID=2646786 RepID=UPI0020287501|nr:MULTISPECIES: GntR family transcriptional regulator [unclassified Caballeronia]MDR5765851.1 GntR family transcriptional regulator [Caballeronia sp. LZ028]